MRQHLSRASRQQSPPRTCRPRLAGSGELVADVPAQTLVVVAPRQSQPPRQAVLIHVRRNLLLRLPPDSEEGGQKKGGEEEVAEPRGNNIYDARASDSPHDRV